MKSQPAPTWRFVGSAHRKLPSAVAFVPIPHQAVLAIDVVNHAVATGEDVPEVPACADLAIRGLGPPEAAICAAFVPIPHQAVLAIDVVDHAVATGEDMLEVPACADLAIRGLGPPEAAIAAAFVAIPHQAVLAIGVVNQAVATGEDMLEVPACADLAIRGLGPPEAAIAASFVPIPHQAVLAFDVVNQAPRVHAGTRAPASPSASSDLRLDQGSDTANRRCHGGAAQHLQEISPLHRVHVSPPQSGQVPASSCSDDRFSARIRWAPRW